MQLVQRGSGVRFHDTQRQAIGRARLARELQKSRPFCMPTLSYRAKSQALRAARFTGAFRSIRDSRWRGRRLLILGYHGVALEDEHEWDAALYISQPRLESQLRTLRRAGCTVLPLDEALRALEDGRLPPRSVAITFDDGNHDFHERAFPVLQALELPATGVPHDLPLRPRDAGLPADVQLSAVEGPGLHDCPRQPHRQP